MLPEKWKIERNPENCSVINEWINKIDKGPCKYDNKTGFIYSEPISIYPDLGHSYSSTTISRFRKPGFREEDYILITFEQFEKHVLKEQEEKTYTIEDLAEGRVQLEYTNSNPELLTKIMRIAGLRNLQFNMKGHYQYYGKSKDNYKDYCCDNSPQEGLPIQHISKFKLEEEKPKEMDYTISKASLKEIHDIACPTWKGKIRDYASADPFIDSVTLSEKQVKEMFDAATPQQLPVLKIIFKDYKYKKTLEELKENRDHFLSNGSAETSMIALRGGTESYYLNNQFNWEITRVGNIQLLTPKQK